MTGNLDPQTATRAALAEEINRLRALTAKCSCGTTYATYEGPEADCPLHGVVRAFNEAMQETAQLRLALADAITRIGNEELRTADAREQRDAYIVHLQHKFTALLGELQIEESNVKYVAAQRDQARRDLAAATTALQRIRKLHRPGEPFPVGTCAYAGHPSGVGCDHTDPKDHLTAAECVHCYDSDGDERAWPCPTYTAAVLPAAGDDSAATCTCDFRNEPGIPHRPWCGQEPAAGDDPAATGGETP